MDALKQKISDFLKKYKYAALILVIGIALLLIPSKSTKVEKQDAPIEQQSIQTDLSKDLENILSSIKGAGRVEVMLTISKGQETFYQSDSDQSTTDNSSNKNTDTVILTDSSKNEYGMVTRVDPAQYQGAVIICQGADSPAIRLAIIDAVSKVTGLGADRICVLKMK